MSLIAFDDAVRIDPLGIGVGSGTEHRRLRGGLAAGYKSTHHREQESDARDDEDDLIAGWNAHFR